LSVIIGAVVLVNPVAFTLGEGIWCGSIVSKHTLSYKRFVDA